VPHFQAVGRLGEGIIDFPDMFNRVEATGWHNSFRRDYPACSK
jgi:hypothetical protein